MTWGAVTFKEVASLSLSYGGGDRQDRGSGTAAGWNPTPGSVTLSCFDATGASASNYGILADLSITGGGVSYGGKAVLTEIGAQPELNGVTRYNVTLNLIQ